MMLFYSVFKQLAGKDLTLKVELKNNIEISGILDSVDANLNLQLSSISVADPEKYPQLLSLKNCFIRGSSIRYIHLPKNEVDTELIQDACKRELEQSKTAAT
mmetsp:Transcript_63518/g.73867  ORF Transcript_63518/g.73867 Transcript_63518/m.73867 type:complete len:102 (-) Transcript_63518:134-439(-)